jgi:hypothetical protein
MRIFLTSGMLFFLPLSATLTHEEIQKISQLREYAKNHINDIDYQLNMYEFAGANYKLDFNYHVGYLNGQRKAYYDIMTFPD